MASNTTKLTFAGLAAIAFVLMGLVPTASADLHDRFGDQVLIDDPDFIPSLEMTEGDFDVCVVSFGETSVGEFGFYLVPDGSAATEVERHALRLVEFEGSEPGTLIRTSDTTEIGQDCEGGALDTANIVYGDVNNNGRYDEGDYVWASTAATLAASSGEAEWTIRLTDTNGGDAGTLVFSQDSDFNAYEDNVVDLTGDAVVVGVFDADRSGGTTPGDSIYLAILEDAGAGALGDDVLPPAYSIRLLGESGPFGSQLLLGDDDHIPLVNEFGTPAGFQDVCVVEFGSGDVDELGFYMSADDAALAGDTVDTNFLRLVENNGNAPGTLVQAGDNTERGRDCDDSAIGLATADVNNNGRYDQGDWVFMTSDADPATNGLQASTGADTWTIRLTETDSGAAGTLAFTSDSDFQAWEDDVDNWDAATGTFGVFDRDRSTIAGNILSQNDSLYLLNQAADADEPGELVEVYSIRLLGDEFGTQVEFGDEDFLPTLEDTYDPHICVVELGDGTNVQDFGFYLMDGANANLPTHAVRLVEVEGNPAGSIVRDSDTTEQGQGCADAGDHQLTAPVVDDNDNAVMWTDLNNNGRYDEGDAVYIVRDFIDGTSAAPDRLRGSTGTDRYTIRLTEAGDSGPGTLMLSGDQDLTSHGQEAEELNDHEVAFFDADQRGEFRRGDTLYLQPDALTDLDLVHLYAVRISGALPGGVAPPPAPPADDVDDDGTDDVDDDGADDDGVTPPPADDDEADDDGVTPPPADDDDDEAEEEPTPGPAAIVVLALVGGALVALRRRK